jgi:hypothetical protein
MYGAGQTEAITILIAALVLARLLSHFRGAIRLFNIF